MKTGHSLAALVAMTVMGCSPVDDQSEDALDAAVRAEAASIATARAESERKELATILADLKEKDPLVQTVYYAQDEQGNKTLNIVRDKEDKQSNADGDGAGAMETFSYSMIGAAAGVMVANMLSNSMVGKTPPYQQGATSHYVGTRKENDDRRRQGVSSYVASSNRAISNSIYQQAKKGTYVGKNGNQISTSKPAFSGSGSRSVSVGG